MALAELPARIAPRVAPPAAAERDRAAALTLEQAAYLALFLLALLTRFWGLGDRALHHDETHHAFYSWQLFMGRGYTHDPLLHGPLLYHIGALIYFLFGDTNTTARVGVALFGSALVVLPYLLRRELGRGAALLAACYLLISPAFLYISRFIRHDMYAVTFEMLAFIGIVRYASTRRAGWLYLLAVALGLMFTTMETFFLYVAMFAPLLAVIFLWRVWKPGVGIVAALGVAIVALIFVLPGKPNGAGGTVTRATGPYTCPASGDLNSPANPIQSNPGPIFGWGALETADNNYALCVRNQPDDNFGAYFVKLGQFARHPAILAALALSVASIVALYALIWRRRGKDGRSAWQRARAEHDATLDAFASLATCWRALVAFGVFFSIYALFFSAFFTNTAGIISGATGSLLYWLAQHNVQRGNQPAYYYLILLAIYEPLVLLWSIIGLLMAGALAGRRLVRARGQETGDRRQETGDRRQETGDRRQETGDRRQGIADEISALHPFTPSIDWPLALPLILAYWSLATVALYSWAGEKMPWLTIHVALPPVLLGAWALARALRWAFGAGSVGADADAAQADNDASLPQTTLDGSLELRPLLLYLALFAAILGSAFVLLTNITAANSPGQNIAGYVLPVLLLVVALLTAGYGLARGLRAAVGALLLALALFGALFTVRSAYQLSYRWGDTPRELMIFVQTSPDVTRVLDRLAQASIRRTSGLNMPVWYDNETIWNWYMRRYTKAQQQQPNLTQPPPADVQAVLMLQENLDSNPQNLQQLQGFRVQRYPLRWWFPEDQMYRLPDNWRTATLNDSSSLLARLLRNPLDGKAVAQAWQYMLYRELPAPLGSTDFVLAVRPDLANEIGLGTGTADKVTK